MMRILFFGIFTVVAATCSFAQNIPKMPMKMPYENTLEYTWSQKEVFESKLLSDMEAMGVWEHAGFGGLSLSHEKPYKGQSSLLITSPTKGEYMTQGRPWGTSSAVYKVQDEDWSPWNRISFWVYPDLPGFKNVSICLIFHNDGAEKVPASDSWNGMKYQVLENQKWNQVYLEIAHLGRDRVTGVEVRYKLQGNEPGAADTAKFYIDELYLEKVNADHFEGWDVAPGEIAYNHTGYVAGFPKTALVSDRSAKTFSLIDATSSQTVIEKPIEARKTSLGTFQVLDFSEVDAIGRYAIKVGDRQTKPFQINRFNQLYRNSIIKTINHFYSQRCGFAVEGIHDVCHRDWMCVHGDKMIQINGGWHDAGDLSQGLVNTAEATYAMLSLANDLRERDAELSGRLLEEAKWGLGWLLKNRFGDGFRSNWAVYDMWTDGIIGTVDDVFGTAENSAHCNFMAATAEATAAALLKADDPYLADHALACAVADWGFASENAKMDIELAGAGLNASLALYDATKNERYKTAAFSYADYIVQCQQQDDLDRDLPLKGFFYRSPDKEDILHYSHGGHEHDVVVGLVGLSQLFPESAATWENALRLYADYYKTIASYTAPYYMLPAGIYDITKVWNDPDEDDQEVTAIQFKEQVGSGVRLNDRYYLRRFPVWGMYRGNSGTILSQAKGLSKIARHFNDKDLLSIAYRQLNWHLGLNPFNQSLMYGEGHRYAGQYSVSSGNIVGGLPVGVQTHFNRDAPYWPTENGYTWKEIWVHSSTRWLMLMSDFVD
jgi:Glycosyl hydrolase family 9./N-terminal ig-like domain of cellulase.